MTQEEPDGNGAPEESMAALLEAETTAYPELRRGEIIEGTVVGTDRDGVLIDIGAKSEGVVPPSEMHCLQPEGASKLKNGDKALVFVLQPESPEGQIILSMDRARGERGWRVLQDYLDENESFEGYVTGSNKGGLLVNVEGINAFVPLSQIVAGPARGSPENTQRALAEWVGRTIMLKVIELNRRRNRAILSERAAVQEKRAAEKERLLKELTEGEVKEGRITSIRDFGIFVDIGGADGLVHLSELSWERTPRSPHEMFKVGDEVPVYVLKIDAEAKKIALSVRRAQPERWLEIVSQFREGQVVPGQVTKLAPFGAFVRLEGPIEGLVHISELVERRIAHPNEVVREGDVLPVKIVRIEYDRHRLGLSLKQARSSAEQDGWTFSERGGAIEAPKDALDRLGLAAMPNQDGTAVVDESTRKSAPEAAAETTTASKADGAEPEATEAPATETPKPEATEEPAAETAEPEATEAPATETPKPEATEEPATETAEPEATEEPATETAEPEATEEPAAETAEPEATEEPAAETAEPEATEEPAVDGADDGDKVSGSSEDAEPATENSAPSVTEQSSDAFNKAKE
ncbi:MAG: S1 RNA-binding domain-containing protein [Chloroflexi bacterium]|nr:S1 RNA-binding domain-containing protein [Chloroflexota bacterium]